jgi:spermidine/putrescine-binding protein
MNFPLSLKHLVKRRRPLKRLIIGAVVACTALALAIPAAAQQTSGSTVSSWSDVASVPTLDSSTAMANLKVIPAQMTCAELAKTTVVAGQSIDVTNYQTASASPGSPPRRGRRSLTSRKRTSCSTRR